MSMLKKIPWVGVLSVASSLAGVGLGFLNSYLEDKKMTAKINEEVEKQIGKVVIERVKTGS